MARTGDLDQFCTRLVSELGDRGPGFHFAVKRWAQRRMVYFDEFTETGDIELFFVPLTGRLDELYAALREPGRLGAIAESLISSGLAAPDSRISLRQVFYEPEELAKIGPQGLYNIVESFSLAMGGQNVEPPGGRCEGFNVKGISVRELAGAPEPTSTFGSLVLVGARLRKGGGADLLSGAERGAGSDAVFEHWREALDDILIGESIYVDVPGSFDDALFDAMKSRVAWTLALEAAGQRQAITTSQTLPERVLIVHDQESLVVAVEQGKSFLGPVSIPERLIQHRKDEFLKFVGEQAKTAVTLASRQDLYRTMGVC